MGTHGRRPLLESSAASGMGRPPEVNMVLTLDSPPERMPSGVARIKIYLWRLEKAKPGKHRDTA